MRVGVDTGGTFTDVVCDDGRIAKVLSTPADPAEAVAGGLAAVGAGSAAPPELLAHGTTVATNALLEGTGACVALVTTRGLADVIEIARQDRPSLYDPWADRPPALVPRELRLEAGGRLGADGVELEPVDPGAVPAVPAEVAVVAVCLLHADLDGRHEREVAAVLRDRGLEVACSHEVSPEFREYERTVTTVVDAALGPACQAYLGRLAGSAGEVVVMTSAGGLVRLGEAMARPATLLLSGPAGGVRAAAAAAVAAGFPDAVCFDMGGTSTDVCLVVNGAPAPAAERTVAGYPVRLPALDIHTIGAGGGSIARIDAGGALRVGPQSAGAVPGPACYGRGGAVATVTDADLIAGRIPHDAVLPGIGALDVDAALAALDGVGVTAEGVLAVVDSAMEQAVRKVSVERGVDPRSLALVAFGGAGPLHACALADALGMPTVVVPPRAGVLSAAGLLASPRHAVLVRSWPTPGDHDGLSDARFTLARAAARRLLGVGADTPGRVMVDHRTARGTVTVGERPPVEVELALDCRYAGQSHELTVASVAAFEGEHRRRNGYARPGARIEVTALRATARLPPAVPLDRLPAPPGPTRRPVEGPAVLAEDDCTVWVAPGWRADVGPGGSWVMTR
ncbi:MAG TPA: hydantoinase/oxoprolinase family protein [Acidimicrobiales bacterium]|nr:hydantoinase/oxoprolinase family protein [Acidimicrobiales bacterium]